MRRGARSRDRRVAGGVDVTPSQIERLAHDAYPEATAVKVRVYEVSGSVARGWALWRAEASIATPPASSTLVSHPGATAQEALESLSAELVRVKRARCDNGTHRLTRSARERLESEGIDPRAVLDSAGRAHDREGAREWVVACPTGTAGEVARYDADLPTAPASIETITLVAVRMARGVGTARAEWIEWKVRE